MSRFWGGAIGVVLSFLMVASVSFLAAPQALAQPASESGRLISSFPSCKAPSASYTLSEVLSGQATTRMLVGQDFDNKMAFPVSDGRAGVFVVVICRGLDSRLQPQVLLRSAAGSFDVLTQFGGPTIFQVHMTYLDQGRTAFYRSYPGHGTNVSRVEEGFVGSQPTVTYLSSTPENRTLRVSALLNVNNTSKNTSLSYTSSYIDFQHLSRSFSATDRILTYNVILGTGVRTASSGATDIGTFVSKNTGVSSSIPGSAPNLAQPSFTRGTSWDPNRDHVILGEFSKYWGPGSDPNPVPPLTPVELLGPPTTTIDEYFDPDGTVKDEYLERTEDGTYQTIDASCPTFIENPGGFLACLSLPKGFDNDKKLQNFMFQSPLVKDIQLLGSLPGYLVPTCSVVNFGVLPGGLFGTTDQNIGFDTCKIQAPYWAKEIAQAILAVSLIMVIYSQILGMLGVSRDFGPKK